MPLKKLLAIKLIYELILVQLLKSKKAVKNLFFQIQFLMIFFTGNLLYFYD